MNGTNRPPERSSLSELEWQAFLYVTRELPGDERATFEARLTTDQSAREAVATATRLSAALLSGPSTVARPRPEPVRLAARPMAAPWRGGWGVFWLASACLLAVCGLMRFQPLFDGAGSRLISHRAAEPAAVEARRLVALWTRGAAAVEPEPVVETWDTAHPVPELDVPGWLLAAVSYEAEDDGIDDRGSLQEN